MREKELRLALICYGGISLAVYMHGITKEIWRLLQASRAFHEGSTSSAGTISGKEAISGSEAVYRDLLIHIEKTSGVKLRVFADIIAGASAGGINGVFLAQAIATGQSLEPLANLWLEDADIERLLDPDARPLRRFTKFWATPIAWLVTRKRGGTVDRTVGVEGRDEVRLKLSQFVRARWFEPPFGGAVFTNLLLNAFDAMAAAPAGKPLIPDNQPLDLIVTATDFQGHRERIRLNSPSEIVENEHRLALNFRHAVGQGATLGHTIELAFAARATASFPGAFPPFTVSEMDGVVASRSIAWPGRAAFLSRILPRGTNNANDLILIDGSVLANAPFKAAIEALRERPARREVDRRFVYIDPKPGMRSVRLLKSGENALPGFFSTILGAMSDIPREQPIRDNLEAIEGRSTRIRRMQRILDAVKPDVEHAIQKLFGLTFFLDSPTPSRLANWRTKANRRAAADSGHAYAAYGHLKLSGVVEELAQVAARLDPKLHDAAFDSFRQSLWAEVRDRGGDEISTGAKTQDTRATLFFRTHDLRYRIRRLRLLARTITEIIDVTPENANALLPVRESVYAALAPYLDGETTTFLNGVSTHDAALFLDELAQRRDLIQLDERTEQIFTDALAVCRKAERRSLLLTYLGFPYFDIATLPMLQGEGLDEFDPIKVDRIAPDDACSIRDGGAAATLKGIELNSFGAFFSRAYRENDYLWGRLHGAERMIDITASTVVPALPAEEIARFKANIFHAILEEERPRLTRIPALFVTLAAELKRGPLAKEDINA
jgi:patatin-related protein